MNIFSVINLLLNYGIENKLIGKYDRVVAQNAILKTLKLDSFGEAQKEFDDVEIQLQEILNYISIWAVEEKLIEDSAIDKELLETEIMGHLTPSQSVVIQKFMEQHKISPEKAAKSYYSFSKLTNYIRIDRTSKNMHWLSPTDYGNLEITINLSKPEKDPKDIEREKNTPSSGYPKCLLCYENVGYAGRTNHPARQNHRVIPVTLTKEEWFLQYSPYVYYNEHAILFSGEHRPMKIDKNSFVRLFEFIDFLPNYFIGSNADLPIVGGSILSHDHFQGGNHTFPMEKAPIETHKKFKNYSGVEVGIVKWQMSTLRLASKNKNQLIELSDKILNYWIKYNDESVEIISHTGETRHNTITPIARKKGDIYEIDLVLRNNRTSEQHPLGIFHPHSEVHHIKKENIGLIEVMGLAVLPGRLKDEMKKLVKVLDEKNMNIILKNIEKDADINKHLDWMKKILEKHINILNLDLAGKEQILKDEVGIRFSEVLEHAGVFKRDEKGKLAFNKFLGEISEL